MGGKQLCGSLVFRFYEQCSRFTLQTVMRSNTIKWQFLCMLPYLWPVSILWTLHMSLVMLSNAYTHMHTTVPAYAWKQAAITWWHMKSSYCLQDFNGPYTGSKAQDQEAARLTAEELRAAQASQAARVLHQAGLNLLHQVREADQ